MIEKESSVFAGVQRSKKCFSCKTEKQLTYFSKNSSKKDGLGTECKECSEKYGKEYRKLHKNKTKEYNDQYRELHREEKLEYDKEYYQTHRTERKQYLLDNVDTLKQKRKEYRKEHKKEIREYRRQRKQSNISAKIADNLRTRVRCALKNEQKSGSAVRDLGCSVGDLKLWLEQQFHSHQKTGEQMTWDNYGFYGWHIDHVVPLVCFDLTDQKQFKKACHWFNLRPLWSDENWSRSKFIK